VNARGENGWAPLPIAVLKGHKDVIELLMKHGARW